MTSDDPAAGHLPDAAFKTAKVGAPDWTPNPRRRFASPELLMEDARLSDAEKLALLQEWLLEIDNRLKAEEEGMSASDPIAAGAEARMADEEARVRAAIADISAKIGTAG